MGVAVLPSDWGAKIELKTSMKFQSPGAITKASGKKAFQFAAPDFVGGPCSVGCANRREGAFFCPLVPGLAPEAPSPPSQGCRLLEVSRMWFVQNAQKLTAHQMTAQDNKHIARQRVRAMNACIHWLRRRICVHPVLTNGVVWAWEMRISPLLPSPS